MSPIKAVLFWTFISVLCVDAIFAKDVGDDDVPFPPTLQPSDSGLLVGHLLPLGYQREPEGPVKEYTQPLAPTEFWEQHARDPYVPLVYRQAIAKAPAVTNWQSDEYIREKYGDLDVLVEKKIEDRMNPVRLRMPLSEFLDNYHDKQWYVVSLLPDPMRAEMQVPRSLLCGNFKDSILESNLWLSSGGTRSVLHYDADHNLHCLISGRKDFIMIPNKYGDKLDLADNKKSGSGFTHMNVDKVDLVKNPEVSEVPWTWATLQPGDCIFISSRYFHQVRSYGRSVAATIMWDPFREFNDSDCATRDIDKYTALSDVRLQWTYKKGDKVIDMGYINVETMRNILLNEMEDEELDKFTPEVLSIIYAYNLLDEEEDEQLGEEDMEYVRKVFSLMDKDQKGYLTEEELRGLDIETLKLVTRLIEPAHGPIGENTGSRDEL
ncbi:bifunctional peptidase and (3S)-lysyl hydroxylase Jmjd7-like [Branchiostoma lanceolatum]|uniref:bifunctional peptidase and (3S)-lysyl hydroxylase Jmjd7-like n=1 Tax=Branchiostoma lanceolatum TaxID=7740 RepID=UPI0034569433